MNKRILEIIKYKTGGRKKEFAELLGWTQPYLTKLIKGDNIGLTPIKSILQVFPDINARWLITGEGAMIDINSEIRNAMFANILSMLDFEKYMPVMTLDELHEFEDAVRSGIKPNYSLDVINRWEQLLGERRNDIQDKFNKAIGESDRLCKGTKTK